MSLKLYTYPGNFRAFKALIAAEYNGVAIEVPEFKMLEDNRTPEFLAKSPLGKVPVLETEQGSLFESNAIARYIARIRRDTNLYGASFFESGQVDSWIDFCSHELELPAVMWIYPVLGYMPANPAAAAKAKEDLARGLAVLEAHLADKTYLVGNAVTLADITVASTLVYPFKMVCDEAYRAAFPCVTRWFTTLVNQPEFIAVIGEVPLCAQEIQPAGAAAAPANAGGNNNQQKKQKKKKSPKKKAKKQAEAKSDAAPAPAPAKKQEHPLKVLDKTAPSNFIGDAWKKHYSNDDYAVSMAWFWENFDAEGWSLHHCNYKYNHENVRMFMTCNLTGGFIQRSGEIRKWLFGVQSCLGEEGQEGGIEVQGIWLIRGQSIQPLIDANDDAEHYTWTKLDHTDEATRARVAEYWTSETTIEGKVIGDGKVFK